MKIGKLPQSYTFPTLALSTFVELEHALSLFNMFDPFSNSILF